MKPQVSFVLPCWNAAFVINQTIDSFFEQSNENFEVIIVDDGSSDKTIEIINDIDDDRFKIINLRCRHGAGMARNIGNMEAHTPYICVTDCGDVYYENKVQTVINYFKDNPDIDIMCSATDSLSGDECITPRVFKGRHGEKLGFEHPGVSYRKQVVEQIKYRTTSLHTDQYDAFFNEAALAGFKFGVYKLPLSAKCTFNNYTGGRNLDKALLVKANIYREFGITLPDWLIEHERNMKCQNKMKLQPPKTKS